MQNKNLLFIMLGTTSVCSLFGIKIADRISRNYSKVKVIHTTYSIYSDDLAVLPCVKKGFKTYKNNKEFLINSLLILPRIILYTLFQKNTVYIFPHHHFWHAGILFFLKLFRKETIFAVHDDKMHLGLESFIEKILTNYQIRATDRHVYISDFVRRSVIKTLGYEKPSVVIPLGPFIYKGMKSEPRELSNSRPVELLLFGTIAEYKGIKILIAAYKMLKDQGLKVHLNVIGKHCEPNLVNNEFIEEYEINIVDRFIKNDEMHIFFNNADVVVLPYLEASQSGVIPVSNYCCIPSVVTEVGGLPEMIEHEKTGIICKPNEHDLVNAIARLIEDPEFYAAISNNISKVNADTSWERIAERWFSFIKNV